MRVFRAVNTAGREELIAATDWAEARKIARLSGMVRKETNCRRIYPYWEKGIDIDIFKPTIKGIVKLNTDGISFWYSIKRRFYI